MNFLGVWLTLDYLADLMFAADMVIKFRTGNYRWIYLLLKLQISDIGLCFCLM